MSPRSYKWLTRRSIGREKAFSFRIFLKKAWYAKLRISRKLDCTKLIDIASPTSEPKLNKFKLDKANRLLRQSKKRDYYKILGVPRDADTKTISKAYRDASKKYHPDKYRGELDADAVSRKMAEINSAYEVLSNEGNPPYKHSGANVQNYE